MPPLFDFECKKCKVIEEHLVQVDVLPNCSICTKPMKKKQSVPAGFILKGDGFYKPNKGSTSE